MLLFSFSSFAWFLLVVWFVVRLLCGLVGAVVVVLVRGLRLCLLLPLRFCLGVVLLGFRCWFDTFLRCLLFGCVLLFRVVQGRVLRGLLFVGLPPRFQLCLFF